jgi:hypothetical protein
MPFALMLGAISARSSVSQLGLSRQYYGLRYSQSRLRCPATLVLRCLISEFSLGRSNSNVSENNVRLWANTRLDNNGALQLYCSPNRWNPGLFPRIESHTYPTINFPFSFIGPMRDTGIGTFVSEPGYGLWSEKKRDDAA